MLGWCAKGNLATFAPGRASRSTHIGALLLIGALQNIPEHIDRRVRLDRDTGLHALLVDILDQCTRTGGLRGALIGRFGRGDGGDGGLVVEAVQVTAGLLEFLDPFMRLDKIGSQRVMSVSIAFTPSKTEMDGEGQVATDLRNHHVAVKGAPRPGLEGSVHAATNVGDHRASDGHVGYKVAIHDVDVQPVGPLLDLFGAIMAQIGEVGAENRRRNDRGRRHGGGRSGRRGGRFVKEDGRAQVTVNDPDE